MFEHVLHAALAVLRARWQSLLVVAALLVVPSLITGAVAFAFGGGTELVEGAWRVYEAGINEETIVVEDHLTVAMLVRFVTSLFIGFVVLLAWVAVCYVVGVRVALGSSVRVAFRGAFGASLRASSQLSVVYLWPAVALIGALALAVVSPWLTVAALLGILAWCLALTGRAFTVLGCIATGDRAWRPTAAMDMLDGSLALAGVRGVLVVTLFASALASIPIVGIVFSLATSVFTFSGIAAFFRTLGGPSLALDGTLLPADPPSPGSRPVVAPAAPAPVPTTSSTLPPT